MAKGNLILGTSRGKLGDIVTYRSMGQQMSRVRVRNVKNPKTQLQTLQRLVLSSAAKTVAVLSPLVDHSFQSVAYGAESKRHARKQIMKVLREQMVAAFNDETRLGATQQVGCFPSYGAGAAVAAYPISQGSLPEIQYEMTGTSSTYGQAGFLNNLVVTAENATTLTVADFCAQLGVSTDTQLTFVFLTPKVLTAEDSTPAFYNGDLRYARVNFLPSAVNQPIFVAAPSVGGVASKAVIFSASVLDATRSTNAASVLFSTDEADYGAVAFKHSTVYSTIDNPTAAFAVIASRYENGTWLRSTQHLAVGYPLINATAATAAQSVLGYNFFEDLLDAEQQQQAVAEDRYLNKEKN